MVPNDDFEFDLMGTFTSFIFWLGINDMRTKGTYIDIDTNREFLFNGFPLTDGAYPWFDVKHPFPNSDYDCLAYSRSTAPNKGLFNRACSSDTFTYHYVCEYKLPIE